MGSVGIPPLLTQPNKMKLCLAFILILGVVIGSEDQLVGKWKEDSTKRENLDEFLKARGVNSIKIFFSHGLPAFELTMEITKEGNKYILTGTKGPSHEEFRNERVPDNTTRNDIDLGSEIGGMRQATSEFVGSSLISYLHKPDDDTVDVVLNQTVTVPDVMVYTIRDVPSGVTLIQHLDRQP